jgi:hypothetical protein
MELWKGRGALECVCLRTRGSRKCATRALAQSLYSRRACACSRDVRRRNSCTRDNRFISRDSTVQLSQQ